MLFRRVWKKVFSRSSKKHSRSLPFKGDQIGGIESVTKDDSSPSFKDDVINGEKSSTEDIDQPECKLLNRLPVELLQYIATFLPPSSAAALALCSKGFLRCLGHGYFDQLKSNRETTRDWSLGDSAGKYIEGQAEWARFLLLLDRDSLRTIFCPYCKKLHCPEIGANKFYGCDDLCLMIYGWEGFNYPSIFAAMKLHRMRKLDPDTFCRLSRTFTKYTSGYTHQRAIKAKIIKDSFYVRVQHRILYSSKGQLDFHPHADSSLLSLCPHVRVGNDPPNYLTQLIQCQFAHQDANWKCSICSGLKQCKDCLTEFQIDGMVFKDAGFAVIITQWHDLGECLTPFDPKWLCHYEHFSNANWNSPMYVKKTFEGADFDFAAQITQAEEDDLFIKHSLWLEYRFI